ncbi:MAG: ATP synthase F1 subunit epsilon [Petrimonas sp.]|uniref:ATP synthase F1 subunit epsilon n=1 Tax=Petrimonas sp. TaxID=2023866 RepID=UPI002B3F9408|nr:ATP synthase F1 subunit epsilon [Petrimonas sp.]MEA5063850.1 ATP synthase F1 subunit epsilon [Petrimonas sp.]
MQLEIISPKKMIFTGSVVSVTLPGALGSFQILEHHAPIISSLVKGKLSFVTDEDEQTELLIEDGFVEMNNNKVTVCLESIIKEL